jgi:hypothetical protein
MSDPDLSAWNEQSRLNPGAAAGAHLDDPRVTEAFTSIATNFAPAIANLQRFVGPVPANVE